MTDYFKRELQQRRTQLQDSSDLSRLTIHLRDELERVMSRPLHVPDVKGMLSRDGGVCSRDGSRLTFDPFAPDEHRCDTCGATYEGERHHLAWVWRYQLWLSERAIHAALLEGLGFKDTGQWAAAVLQEYCSRYRGYPNTDNVLGPTRLFFSTYLESIWLIQVVMAAFLLEATDEGFPGKLRSDLENVVDESSSIIGSFIEGASNRQVWNAAAVLAAGLFLDDAERIDVGLESRWGIGELLRTGVAKQGRWHEGENYHFFALRGFLLAAELARSSGVDLYARFQQLGNMYAAPLVTLFPDLTIPARGDSPFGVSVQQKRFAELWEIGFARTGDERLLDVLSKLYTHSDGTPRDEINEIAEVEQNRPPTVQARDRLGWKALLWMKPELGPVSPQQQVSQSDFVEPRGPIVLRPALDRYVSLECDGTGLGHGHPDRLHLTIWDERAVQVDLGTGSYVSDSLHWYRSWLCHTGPVARGSDGRGGSAVSAGWDASGPWMWGQASVADFAGPGTSATRSVIVGDDYVMDVVDVFVDAGVVVDLPVHPLDVVNSERFEEAEPAEPWFDIGYDGLHVGTFRQRLAPLILAGRGEVFLPERNGETIVLISAPGPPGLMLAEGPQHIFPVRSCRGSGRWVQLFAKEKDCIRQISINSAVIQVQAIGGSDTIHLQDREVVIESRGPTVTLSGIRSLAARQAPPSQPQRTRVHWPLLAKLPDKLKLEKLLESYGITMGRESYRRSEIRYPGEDVFSARCCIFAVEQHLHFVVDVIKKELWMRPIEWPDPLLDNEVPDIHSDSVQLYISVPSGDRHDWNGYFIHPYAAVDHIPRIRSVRGTAAQASDMTAHFVQTERGYRLMASMVYPGLQAGSEFLFNVVVNEMYAHRQRRAGQLALSGGGWVYLRGDREHPAEALVGVLQ